MKKRQVLLMFTLLIGVISCTEIAKNILPTFTVTVPPINLSVPPIPLLTGKEVPVGALKAPINLDSTIKAKTGGTIGANAIHSIVVNKVSLRVKNVDEENNLSNFESARIRIYTDTAFTDIAVINFPAVRTDSMVVVPHGKKDISSYLKGTNLSYNLFWKNRKVTTRKLQLEVSISLDVQ